MNYFIIPGLEKNKSAIPTQRIIDAVQEYFQVDLFKNTRDHGFAFSRYCAFYLIYYYGALNVRQIAELFGKDHTTIVHGKQKIEGYLRVDAPDAHHVRFLEDYVLGVKRVGFTKNKKKWKDTFSRPSAHYSNTSPMGIAKEVLTK